MNAEHRNRLAGETSPYLLQHAGNPVDWYPWGPEALERSKKEDKPILLSIGYAACHWCHVMERESFENEDIAKLMNERFVCVKVDREERPDLDEIYMAATVALSGSGGWPMTVFLTPDQRPFFAGTYFPPDDRYGRPGFPKLLTLLGDMWKNERDKLLAQAEELTRHVQEQAQLTAPGSVSETAVADAVRQLSAAFDPRFGGFGAAPKFPPSAALHLLLAHHDKSGDADALSMVEKTLDGMKNGGMYDHVGGGFARYSTDERWLVPHFEKMLYDNAQLARVYLEAHQVTGSDEYRRVAREILDYVARARCNRRKAATTPPRTPTARARKASSSCGSQTRSPRSWSRKKPSVSACTTTSASPGTGRGPASPTRRARWPISRRSWASRPTRCESPSRARGRKCTPRAPSASRRSWTTRSSRAGTA